ncbi:hypothetical protein STEG23_024525 [Scotinomys teguina]
MHIAKGLWEHKDRGHLHIKSRCMPQCKLQVAPWPFLHTLDHEEPGKAEEIHPDPSAPGPHDPTPGEAAELPDIVVSRSWAGDWMLQLQRLST